MTNMLEEETERYWPVLDLRWWQPKEQYDVNTDSMIVAQRRLQQRHISNTGKDMWKNIPTVNEEE